MSVKRTLSLDWSQIHRDTASLADQLRPYCPFDGMVAITRGGLAPALLLSEKLNIRRIETIGVQSYDGTHAGPLHLTKSLDTSLGQGQNWLVVDDLADTGATLAALHQILPHARYGALYAKPAGRPQLDHFVTEVEQDTWIVFPWEV